MRHLPDLTAWLARHPECAPQSSPAPGHVHGVKRPKAA